MNEQRNDLINIPIEFQIACTLRHLKVQEVLQTFINHVSFYSMMGKGYIPGYREATTVVSEYSFKNIDITTKPSFEKADHAFKCIKDIIAWGAKRGMNENKKRIKCIPIVKQLYLTMNHPNSMKKLYLDEDQVLTFSEDFSIVCDTHRHYPKEYLEYFMSRISLADADARAGLKLPEDNASLDFYNLILRGLGKLNLGVIRMTEKEIDFVDRMQKFHFEVFLIRDFSKRKAAYQNFYLDHYNELIK